MTQKEDIDLLKKEVSELKECIKAIVSVRYFGGGWSEIAKEVEARLGVEAGSLRTKVAKAE